MNERITEIQARLAAINTEIDTAEGDALTALENEVRALNEELAGIQNTAQARQQLRQSVAAGAGVVVQNNAPAQVSDEQRAADAFVKTNRMTIDADQARALTIASGQLAQPTKVDGINDIPGAKVSSIVDMVKIVNCTGMGSHKIAYVKSAGTSAEEHEEGTAIPATGLGQFDFVTITPQSVAVLDFISKQAKKQTTLQYAAKVKELAMVALRRRAAELLTFALMEDEAGMIQDISNGTKAIDAKTLRTIAMNYGGDESVIGGATLILNKADLVAFGDVRGTNEKKALYEITPDASGNTGVIREGGLSVRYIINSTVPAGALFYGNLQALELDLFSDYEVKVSEDFAFDKLMDTIRGDVEMGAGVTVKNGFVRFDIEPEG